MVDKGVNRGVIENEITNRMLIIVELGNRCTGICYAFLVFVMYV